MAATLTVEQEQVSKSHSGDAAHYGLPATLADGRDAVFVPVAPSHLSRFRDRDRAIEWSWRACEKDDPCFFSRPVCLSTTCSVERSNDLGIGIVYDRATGYRFSKERDRYINREIDIYIYIDRERERERERVRQRGRKREKERLGRASLDLSRRAREDVNIIRIRSRALSLATAVAAIVIVNTPRKLLSFFLFFFSFPLSRRFSSTFNAMLLFLDPSR